jgi:L-rhamnose mutarotase
MVKPDMPQKFLRIGASVGIRPDLVDRYCDLHANAWPEVRAQIQDCNIRNYSIFLLRERNIAFSYYEYVGSDRAADAAKMAANPVVQNWWGECRPCQLPLAAVQGDRLWTSMDQIFFQE